KNEGWGGIGSLSGVVGTTSNSDISPNYPTIKGDGDNQYYYQNSITVKRLVNTEIRQLEKNGYSVDKITAAVTVDQINMLEADKEQLREVIAFAIGAPDCVYYDRKERVAGESKYPLKKMLALAFNGISSFSVKPISMILGAGMIIVALSLLAAIYALISYCTGHVVPGWTSLILSIWFLGGIQLMAIGLVGQYIGKIYIEVKHRPRYNIEKVLK
ncbi:Ribonuclease III, partial [human gut metagenome]